MEEPIPEPQEQPTLHEPPFPTGEQRTWAMLAHLLAIPGYIVGLGYLSWVGPLVIWIKKRHESPFIAFHALESLLFQLLCTAALAILRSLVFFSWQAVVTFLAIPAISVVWAIIAGLKANNGESYEYPVVGTWAHDNTNS